MGNVVAELRRAGIDADEERDGYLIRPGDVRPAVIDSHGDHRMAMAFAVARAAGPGDLDRRSRPAWRRRSRATGRCSSGCGATAAARVGSAYVRVIAIDGPAGSGKSTVARALADRLELGYLDTGAMYRAVTFAALRRGIDPSEADQVARIVARPSSSRSGPDGVRRRRRRRHHRDPRARGQPGRQHRGRQPGRAGRDGPTAAGLGGRARRRRARGPRHRDGGVPRCRAEGVPDRGSGGAGRAPVEGGLGPRLRDGGRGPCRAATRSTRAGPCHRSRKRPTRSSWTPPVSGSTRSSTSSPRRWTTVAEARPGDDVEIWTGRPEPGLRHRLHARARASSSWWPSCWAASGSSARRRSPPRARSSWRPCTGATSTSR